MALEWLGGPLSYMHYTLMYACNICVVSLANLLDMGVADSV